MPTNFNRKNCAQCGRTFGCGVNSDQDCWCAALPQTLSKPNPELDCFCPECLAKELTEVAAPESTTLVQGEDYYLEDGLLVMTAAYHMKRGSCCGSGCRWCPFDPKHELGVTRLAADGVILK